MLKCHSHGKNTGTDTTVVRYLIADDRAACSMYYSEAVGKIEMYLLCQKYHMSGCVQYEPTNEMMVELYGEERKIDNFMPVLEKYFNRKPCKVIEMNGEPDYGVGDFRIG